MMKTHVFLMNNTQAPSDSVCIAIYYTDVVCFAMQINNIAQRTLPEHCPSNINARKQLGLEVVEPITYANFHLDGAQ